MRDNTFEKDCILFLLSLDSDDDAQYYARNCSKVEKRKRLSIIKERLEIIRLTHGRAKKRCEDYAAGHNHIIDLYFGHAAYTDEDGNESPKCVHHATMHRNSNDGSAGASDFPGESLEGLVMI